MHILRDGLSCVVLGISLAACGGSSTGVDEKTLVEVAQAAARDDDRVTVAELAEWLIEGREDFHLVDVRAAGDFEQGSIGGAENIPLAALVTAETLATLPADRKIVVYSNGSENAAKAAVLLRLAGLNAHLLAGGYNAWHARILNPDITAEEVDGESLQVSAQRAYACYFVGSREGDAAQRSDESGVFVPPVFEVDDELALELPTGEESC
jgi:rhodanese-related sulfurtransferase